MMKKRKFKPNLVKHVKNNESTDNKVNLNVKSNLKNHASKRINGHRDSKNNLVESKGIFDQGLNISKKISMKNEPINGNGRKYDIKEKIKKIVRKTDIDTKDTEIENFEGYIGKTTHLPILEKLMRQVEINRESNQISPVIVNQENFVDNFTVGETFSNFINDINERFVHFIAPKNMPWEEIIQPQISTDFPSYIRITQKWHNEIDEAAQKKKSGKIGKLRIYKSGKMEMLIGENVFTVTHQTDTFSRKDLMSYSPDIEQSGSNLTILGTMSNHNYKLIPKIDHIL
ncbi:hypothetical protein A3Q56_06278 [Intoshia linei]|uniref:Uncharacterized protein n=1 Tax=Intoshia linei TaxID=1819745 RepID=A0A177AVE6_9BILA|nr:hypothetical protein A3Q56_06278 [Intoshia linei]